ncbi:hypothetical protein LCGC14_1665370, partial [marine sediment metagenome]
MFGMDSSANLLFKIAGDSSDARADLRQFKGVVKKDLRGIEGDFDRSSKGIVGNLGKWKGALIRIVASVGGVIYAENGPEDADGEGNLRMPLSGIVPANTAFEVHAFMTGTP